MNFRAATPADAPALSAFGARAFVESYAHLMERSELEDYVLHHFNLACQQQELADSDLQTWLALDGEIAGYAQVAQGSWPGCPLDAAAPASLKRIYVDARWHGAGIAQQLLRLCEQEALARRCDVLWLAVWELNPRAIAFYQKSGFQIVGRQGFPIGHEVQSDFVMRKPLANELR